METDSLMTFHTVHDDENLYLVLLPLKMYQRIEFAAQTMYWYDHTVACHMTKMLNVFFLESLTP
jgi:hypothetical protein